METRRLITEQGVCSKTAMLLADLVHLLVFSDFENYKIHSRISVGFRTFNLTKWCDGVRY